MRKLYIVIVLSVFVFGILSFMHIIEDEDKFYYAFEEKIPLISVEGKFVVRYRQKVEEKTETDQLETLFQDISVSWQDDRTAIISIPKRSDLADIRNLLESENVYTVQPMYRVEKGAEMPVTDELVISVPDQNKSKIAKLHEQYQLTVLETNKIFQLLKVPEGEDALEIANRYQESGLVRFSHPNFMASIEFSQAIPNDPYFLNQFYLRNTGQVFNPVENHSGTPGADISVMGAWEVTMGNNGIVVAVIDAGVTSNHPDLPNTRQIRLNGSNFSGGNANDPSPRGIITMGMPVLE